jgi:hypothetical protein
MEFRQLGHSGLKVPLLTFGTGRILFGLGQQRRHRSHPSCEHLFRCRSTFPIRHIFIPRALQKKSWARRFPAAATLVSSPKRPFPLGHARSRVQLQRRAAVPIAHGVLHLRESSLAPVIRHCARMQQIVKSKTPHQASTGFVHPVVLPYMEHPSFDRLRKRSRKFTRRLFSA